MKRSPELFMPKTSPASAPIPSPPLPANAASAAAPKLDCWSGGIRLTVDVYSLGITNARTVLKSNPQTPTRNRNRRWSQRRFSFSRLDPRARFANNSERVSSLGGTSTSIGRSIADVARCAPLSTQSPELIYKFCRSDHFPTHFHTGVYVICSDDAKLVCGCVPSRGNFQCSYCSTAEALRLLVKSKFAVTLSSW